LQAVALIKGAALAILPSNAGAAVEWDDIAQLYLRAPRPSLQGWQLLSIFLATVTGLVAGPLPVGAWAFCALTFTVVTKTLTFQQAFAAYLNDVIWLIVIAFFFARGFVKVGEGATRRARRGAAAAW
jgi:di/tricarboxylate transporter